MTEKGCPHAVCRVGLWYVVRSGCLGEIRQDPVNGDNKVWFLDCEGCAARSTRIGGEQAEEQATVNQSVWALPEWY